MLKVGILMTPFGSAANDLVLDLIEYAAGRPNYY